MFRPDPTGTIHTHRMAFAEEHQINTPVTEAGVFHFKLSTLSLASGNLDRETFGEPVVVVRVVASD